MRGEMEDADKSVYSVYLHIFLLAIIPDRISGIHPPPLHTVKYSK